MTAGDLPDLDPEALMMADSFANGIIRQFYL
jgi:hypothetical protein